ncbi:ROK family protein [Carnobacteriaceae bacterium zg-C25]|nr:ROK family protein [Carnobacteriaceae bacterium zg-C25]
MTLYGSLEAGGTKFICAVGNESFEVVDKIQFPTTTPDETIAQVIAFFKQFPNLVSVAIGSFGPVDVDTTSKTYGFVMDTPKPNWSNVDLVGPIQRALNVPVFFTTDVNSSAYGEVIARKDVTNLVYYTIGTGIGGGAYMNGEFIGGLGHTEMGHTLVRKHETDASFEGVCPFHKGCLEGMACGPSLEARTGMRGEHIPLDDAIWDVQAYYIAQAVVQATLLFRPEVVVLGGGVMGQSHMIKRVQEQFKAQFNDYIPLPNIEDYIVVPAVENNGSATLGNFALAKKCVSASV